MLRKTKYGKKWMLAIQVELNTMHKNIVWTLIKRPDKIKTFKSKWIYTRKIQTEVLENYIRHNLLMTNSAV